MNTKEINDELKYYKNFIGAFPLDKIPILKKRPIFIIVNTDPSTEPGEHWVSIYLKSNKKGEYFDSFGFPPKNEIRRYLDDQCPRGWSRINFMLQSITAISCGVYCVVYVKIRSIGYTLRQFIQLFTLVSPSINELILSKLYKKLR